MRQNGLTQASLAAAIGSNQATVQRYLGGRIPRTEELLSLARHFNVSMEWLVTGAGDPSSRASAGAPCARCAELEREVRELRAQLDAVRKVVSGRTG